MIFIYNFSLYIYTYLGIKSGLWEIAWARNDEWMYYRLLTDSLLNFTRYYLHESKNNMGKYQFSR